MIQTHCGKNGPFFPQLLYICVCPCVGFQEKEMEKQKILYQQARLHARGAAEMVLQMISASKGDNYLTICHPLSYTAILLYLCPPLSFKGIDCLIFTLFIKHFKLMSGLHCNVGFQPPLKSRHGVFFFLQPRLKILKHCNFFTIATSKVSLRSKLIF